MLEPTGSGTNYTEIQVGAQSTDITYTLPTTTGSNGQYLQFTTGGQLQWSTVAAGVTDGDKDDITVSGSGANWNIRNDSVTSPKILDGTIALVDMGANSVDSTKIGDKTVSLSDLNGAWGANAGSVLKWDGNNWRPGTDNNTDAQTLSIDSTTVGSSERFAVSISSGNTVNFDVPQGTVTSVGITQPAAGITVTNSPVTTSGNISLALANDLGAVEGLTTNGIAVRTGDNTWTTRSIAGAADPSSTALPTINDFNGVNGNPTISISTSTSTTKLTALVATTANITLSGTQTIDGVALSADNRVLVKNQNTASQNGLYVVRATAWVRATDLDANTELNNGVLVYISRGTANGGKYFRLATSTEPPLTITTSALSFSETLGAGVTDGDKDDITVSNSGANWNIRNDSVTTPKILNGTILFEDIGQNSASPGQVIKWNGTAWAAAADNTGGSGSTDLSWTGASSPYTLNSSSGTDVDFAQGGGITLSTSGATLTIAAVDQSITNEVLTISDGTNTEALGGQTLTVAGGGINSASYNATTNTLTISGTESDGSASNEGILGVGAGSGTTATITTNTTTGNAVTIEGGGIVAITETTSSNGGTITITATENDGSTTNELQTIANTSDATSHTVTLSNSGGSVQLIQGAGIDLTTGGNSGAGTVTIAATNSGTVTSVGITAPAAGITVSNSPITSSGNITLALADDLAAVEGLTSIGVAVRTNNVPPTWTTRSLTVANPIAIQNATGASDNPFIYLNNGDYGDISIANSNLPLGLRGDVWTIDANVVDSTNVGNNTLSVDDINGGWGVQTGSVLKWNGTNWRPGTDETGGGGGVTDGDKGDITVSGSGATWTIDADVVDSTNVGNKTLSVDDINGGWGAAAGTPLEWNGTNWRPGVDSSGIYSGSGNVPANTVANVTDYFGFQYDTGASEAIGIDEIGGSTQITSADGNNWAQFQNDSVTINSDRKVVIQADTFDISRATVKIGFPSGGGGVTGSGTTNAIPKWTSSSAIGSSIVQESISGADTIIQIVGRDALRLPLGTTAERPGTPTSGMTRYNTTNGAFEYYDANAWETPLLSATETGLGTAGNVFFADANGKAGGVSALQYNTTHNNLINAASGLSETINSQYKFSMQNNGNVILYGEANGDAADTRCQYSLIRTRGTQASKTAVLNGDIIARHSFGAWNGSGFNYPAAIEAYVDGAVNSGGVVETSFSFATSITGGSRTRRLTVKPNGNIGIGTETPENRLQISGTLGRNTPTTVTGNYTVADGVTWLIVNNSASTTITLPSAASWDGRELTIKTIQAQTVISNTSNVVPIDGDAAGTAILPATDGAWALLVSNGTNWVIMQRG
jgi:hypothetical protein